MGVTVGQWRAQIGCFSQPGPKSRFVPAAIKNMAAFPSMLIVAALLIIGGVEPNPGPPKTRQTLLSSSGVPIDVAKEFETLKQEMGKVIERLETVEKENKTLKNKLAYLEDQSRRNNIVIYGIPESNEESWADCEEKVIDNLNEKLKLEIPLDKSKIERAHRLGKKSTAQTAGVHSETGYGENKPRPIICKFSSFKDRETVLWTTREKMKDANLKKELGNTRVNEDFSAEVRATRRKLLSFLDELRETKPLAKGYLKYNKLFFDSVTYKLDDNDELIEHNTT